jgi:hypothetical protein
MFAVLLLLVPAGSPESVADVKLEHELIFANVTSEQALKWRNSAVWFRAYASDARRRRRIKEDTILVADVYSQLWNLKAKVMKDHPKHRLHALQQLFKLMGKEAFAKGKLPPPVPEKYKKEFETWVARGMPPSRPVTPEELEQWHREDRAKEGR